MASKKKWYEYVGVQAAFILAIGAIIVAVLNICHSRSQLSQDNQQHKNNLSQLKDDLRNKDSEIQRLETLLAPFRTIALEKYTGTEAQILNQLAEQIKTIDASLSDAKNTIESLSEELTLKTSDRKLTQAQRQSLIESLADISGKVLIKADFADSEAKIFASQIKSTLAKTNLEVIEQGYTGIVALYAKGIAMIVNDIKNPPPHAVPIQKAFQGIGIVVPGNQSVAAEFPHDALIIWICHK